MKLQEYIIKLQEILKKYGDLPLVYASDDEGNFYQEVRYLPSTVEFDFKDSELVVYDEKESKVNAVCIN